MRSILSVLLLMVAAAAQAQQPQGRGAGPAPGRIGGAGIGAYPQRTSDPAAVELWHARIGQVTNAPQSYLVDGRQHVLVAAGDALYSFALY